VLAAQSTHQRVGGVLRLGEGRRQRRRRRKDISPRATSRPNDGSSALGRCHRRRSVARVAASGRNGIDFAVAVELVAEELVKRRTRGERAATSGSASTSSPRRRSASVRRPVALRWTAGRSRCRDRLEPVRLCKARSRRRGLLLHVGRRRLAVVAGNMIEPCGCPQSRDQEGSIFGRRRRRVRRPSQESTGGAGDLPPRRRPRPGEHGSLSQHHCLVEGGSWRRMFGDQEAEYAALLMTPTSRPSSHNRSSPLSSSAKDRRDIGSARHFTSATGRCRGTIVVPAVAATAAIRDQVPSPVRPP
jgi:hypothetical protein